jgi:hypothetical protein
MPANWSFAAGIAVNSFQVNSAQGRKQRAAPPGPPNQ